MGVLLEGGNVLEPNGERFLHNADILLEGGRIRKVGPSGSFRIPKDVEWLDLRGRYVVPGLVDFHTHVLTGAAFRFTRMLGPPMRDSDISLFLRCFLAYGVTTVRDIGNYRAILRLREAVNRGRLLGPRILAAGELLEGPTALLPFSRTFAGRREAAAEVRRQARMGADWLKLYRNVSPKLTEAAIREAHRQGLRIAGHLDATAPRQAAAMGIDSLEHVYTLVDEGFLPLRWREGLPRARKGPAFWKGLMMRWLRADLDGVAWRQLRSRLTRRRVVVCPTMVLCEDYFVGPHRDIQRATDRMPSRWRQTWEGAFRAFHPDGAPDPKWEDAWGRMRILLRKLYRAGAVILPGTDTAAFIAFGAPGISLHRELAILESLGFQRAELLRLATAGAARALGRVRELGTIARGRSADLLVLRGNPLDDLRNLREPETVLVRGRGISGRELRP